MLEELLETKRLPNYQELEDYGIGIGKVYTNHGYPIDMALDRLPHGKAEKIVIIHGVCQWLIEHKRLSGAPEKSIERQRATNKRMIEAFIRTGETGVY
jgi:hypothetical protein